MIKEMATCLAALAMAGAAAAGELLIEQRVTDDGTLLVRYTPPVGVRELPLFNRAPTMATVWGEMAAPVDDCATVVLQPRVTITLATGCTSAIFRVKPRLLNRYAINEPAFAVGGEAVMAYIGYYAVALPGHALHWRWTPGPGARAVVAGEVSPQPIDRVIPAAQMTFAAADEGRTAAGFAAAAVHEYVLLGKAEVEALPGGSLIHDRAIDPTRLGAVRESLLRVTERLARAYGTKPAGPWAVVVNVPAGMQGFRGDVTSGRMMSLRFDTRALKGAAEADRTVRQFVAHEVTHWWDTGLFRTDGERPWIHEGHADWVAGLLAREAGQLDAAGWRERMDVALNSCLFSRGDRVSAALPTGHHRDDDAYACGQVLWMLAQWAQPRDGTPVDVAASPFRGSTAPIDAKAVARWADGGDTGSMHRLLFDPQQGFRSALLRDWGGAIEASELRSGEPVPAAIRGRLGTALMVTLMTADCDGALSIWTQADHFRIDTQPACRGLRGNPNVRRIQGVSPFDDPVGAWQAVRAACQTGQLISVGTDADEPIALACPAKVPDMPIQQALRLRPQAVERLGLGL
ncbi:MAG TPA: hypothetical protein VGF12_19405 [Roseateles sp.]|uniref:hypothetical protein n=1 Tax=Roseateles sp. TaxID=1971397 RepID=UPI002ED9BCC9